MTSDGINAQELRRFMKPFVMMVVQEIAPKKDEISSSQAFRDYGRKWIESKTQSGDLTPRYVGQRKLYSIAQIETLKAVESTPAMITPRNPAARRGRPPKPKTEVVNTEPKKRGRPRKVQTDTSDNIPL